MKQNPKRKHRSKALPVLGAAGLSLSLASGASAYPSAPSADVRTPSPGDNHAVTLGEEEISDVSLATFYVFDKEGEGLARSDVQLVRHGCHGCHGCGGCHHGCGCHGCHGCGGCHHGCGCHGCRGCHGCGGCGWWGGWWGGCGCGGCGVGWCIRGGRWVVCW
jgi:hypothetical protein